MKRNYLLLIWGGVGGTDKDLAEYVSMSPAYGLHIRIIIVIWHLMKRFKMWGLEEKVCVTLL